MIFISHSSQNEDVARDIRDELEKEHYKCFLSGDDIEADEDWHDKIWKALSDCHAFLGIVTQDFFDSAFCQQEVGAALALGKPRLLILHKATKLPGFAARFQACKRNKLLATLEVKARYPAVRAEAWIQAAESSRSYQAANDAYDRFSDEWKDMTDDQKLRWLLAAARNSHVRDECFKIGPFFMRAQLELKHLLTDQWLFENDTESHLHSYEFNSLHAARKKR